MWVVIYVKRCRWWNNDDAVDRVGHIYAIGECGGANEIGRCPECKATIGGTSHQLTEGNELAHEMDGAQGPAWPGMGVNQ